MNRRDALKSLLALPVAVNAVPVLSRPVKYGAVDYERWWKLGFSDTHDVFCDGLKITNCRWFNDITGEAERYVRGPEGHAIYDPIKDDAVTEILRGHIEVRRKQPKD